MKLTDIDPPGTWCSYAAIGDLLNRISGSTFLDIGVGGGRYSLRLCRMGYQGVGVDSSTRALEHAHNRLKEYIDRGKYETINCDVMDLAGLEHPVDFGISMMVMEHIEDDKGFLEKVSSLIKPGGYVIIGVPGRKDRWGIEDETVGHIRRYDRIDLNERLNEAGLIDVEVRSVAVPVSNLLFHIGNLLIRKSTEVDKLNLSKREQSETSGIQEIPFKTQFPRWFRFVLNEFTLYPLFVLQRLFYRTNLGLTMIGIGRKPNTI